MYPTTIQMAQAPTTRQSCCRLVYNYRAVGLYMKLSQISKRVCQALMNVKIRAGSQQYGNH